MIDGVGVRSDEFSPRELENRERERQRLLRRPLVRVLPELRGAMLTWGIAGGIAVLAAFALGRLFYLAPIEYAATGTALFLPPAAAYASLMLGRRTPTFMLYRLILERAPAPPSQLVREEPRKTARRAAIAAISVGICLIPANALGLAFAEAAMGRTRSKIPDHLPEEAVLVTGIYMLAGAAAAWLVYTWISRWEAERRVAALCPPLHSGLMREIYFVEGGDEATPPPAAPSHGAGASTPRAHP